MIDALRALREGAVLGMLPDQDARGVGIHVPFFGRPASTHTGPARLAYRARCALGIGLIERLPGGGFRSRLVAILEPDPAAEESVDVARLTRASGGDRSRNQAPARSLVLAPPPLEDAAQAGSRS
jgi:KDO2-lipid IV(A) lauroyltransferase